MKRLRLDASQLRPALLHPPPSKSDALRRLVLSRIIDRPQLVAPLQAHARPWPQDVERLADALEKLATARPGTTPEIDCGDGAAPLRFLLGQVATRPGRVRLRGSDRLGARPHGPLIESLRASLGPHGFALTGNPWPLEVQGTLRTGDPHFRIAGAESSQYASSLLLAAAALHLRERRPWTVELASPIPSRGYLDLTIDALTDAGFELECRPERIRLTGWHAPATAPPIPTDWSSIGYLLLVAWRSGGAVADVDLAARHPDRLLVQLLSGVGLAVERTAAGEVRVSGAPRGGLEASAATCPDLIPTLAALSCFLPAPSTLTNLSALRHKESDRIEGVRALVAAAGGSETLTGDTLRISAPGTVRAHLDFDSRGDHRLAMAAATLAVCGAARLTLDDPDCVDKSFPGFFRELERAGVRLS